MSRMRVCRQRLRPGSGHLVVDMTTDGPTRLFRISNIKDQISFYSIKWLKNDEQLKLNSSSSSQNYSSTHHQGFKQPSAARFTFEVTVSLTGGIGVSLIHWHNQEYEELIYAYLKTLELAFDQAAEQRFTLSVQSVQLCNQLLNATRQNLLYIQIAPAVAGGGGSSTSTLKAQQQQQQQQQPAIRVELSRQFRYENITTIRFFSLNVADVNLQLEEKLLWKVFQFAGLGRKQRVKHQQVTARQQQQPGSGANKEKTLEPAAPPPPQAPPVPEADGEKKPQQQLIEMNDLIELDLIANKNTYYKRQVNVLLANSNATKYSFNKFHVNAINMILSVYKASKLTPDLLKIKNALGIPLIQFENARIELKNLTLVNENDNLASLLTLVGKHYTQELRSHAISILGSVDFLGNPLGLVVDFKESLSNVLSNGQVSEFVFSITHGVANSVSKFSGSLSDELNQLTMDDRHRETREQIRNIYSNGSIDHFVGGALGFAVGIVGGALSIATQTYRGFNENGFTGAFAGLGRGAVGTVSKPIVGVLDLATGIASAITRDEQDELQRWSCRECARAAAAPRRALCSRRSRARTPTVKRSFTR